MQVEITKKPKSTVSVKGSLTAEEFGVHIQQTTQHIVAQTELPGFRKGKAPEKMVVEKIGEGVLLEEAANAALSKTYPLILREHNIDAIGRPQIRITKLARGNPLEFEADIAMLPEITLPDYKDIAKTINAKPKEEIIVTKEELDKTIDWLRKSRAKKQDSASSEKSTTPEPKQNTPEELPELTDEFAQSLGAYKTADELKNAIRENTKFEKEQKAHDKQCAELLDAVCEKSTLEIPDVLIASEKEKMLAELKTNIEHMGMQWDMYLTHIKKTEEEMKSEWQADAEKRVKSALVFREIAKRETIEPSDDELNTWVSQYVARYDDNEKKDVDLERVKDYAYGIIRNQKVLEFLENSNT